MYYLAFAGEGEFTEADAVKVILSDASMPLQAAGTITIDLDGWRKVWGQVGVFWKAHTMATDRPDPWKVLQALEQTHGYKIAGTVTAWVTGQTIAGGVTGGQPPSTSAPWWVEVATVLGKTAAEVTDLAKRAAAGDKSAQELAKQYGLVLYRDPATGEYRLAVAPRREPSTIDTVVESLKTTMPYLLIGGLVLYLVVTRR